MTWSGTKDKNASRAGLSAHWHCFKKTPRLCPASAQNTNNYPTKNIEGPVLPPLSLPLMGLGESFVQPDLFTASSLMSGMPLGASERLNYTVDG